jgi:putative transposase
MQATRYTYALTFVAHQRKTIFVRTDNAELLLQTLFHYRSQSRYQLHGFAIMPEHLHVLITPNTGQTIERCIQCIKGGYSHAMRKQFTGEIWQPGYHEHGIRNATDFQNQLNYIAQNPIRRHLQNHPYVHTNFADQLDPAPAHLNTSNSNSTKSINPSKGS